MTTATAPGSDVIAHWAARGTRVDAVAGQMRDLRHLARDDEGYPLARASVMNLIVHAADDAGVALAMRRVDDLAIRHPSRGIVVATQTGTGFSLDAEVTLHKHPLADHGLVYERVVLQAHGAEPGGLDTLVIPLLIPHLQSFLWWLGDPWVEHPALRGLAAICDRLVVDSALGPAARLGDLATLIGEAAVAGQAVAPAFARIVLGDVAWARLDGLRTALVQVFDEAHRAEYLEGVTSVEVLGHRSPRSPVSSAEVLFGGWLASRLGWTMPAWSAGGVSLRQGNRRVLLNFVGAGTTRARGTRSPLQGVRVEAELGRRKLSVSLQSVKGDAQLVITETGSGTTRRTIPIPVLSEIEALSRELARIGRDRVYEDAMVAAARVQAAVES
ncbi:MAG: glucose-6-phosphate dehydrogenase assembly protein OpcA [Candidatus Dormibacteria bacterium]